jgi:hypothetical protein
MAQNVDAAAEYIELTIEPIPPDTVSFARGEIRSIIQAALSEACREELSSEFQVEVAQTFPTDAAVSILLTLLSQIAVETYKELVLPRLKKRFRVRAKSQRKASGKKK